MATISIQFKDEKSKSSDVATVTVKVTPVKGLKASKLTNAQRMALRCYAALSVAGADQIART